ncbi:unnamed protein product, partial [Porites lobata]
MLSFCVLNLVFSFVAVLGNFLVIHALWKATLIPPTIKTLFLSLAISDLAVGILSQPIRLSNGQHNFALFCPTVLTVCYYFIFGLSFASFLNVIVITLDRLLAVRLHLRYQDLVTLKRLIIVLVALWITSAIVASIVIFFPKVTRLTGAVIDFLGIILTTVVYIYIYKVVRFHRNQIRCQFQVQNRQGLEITRQNKSAYNALIVYIVFVACYLPFFIAVILLTAENFRSSFLVYDHVSIFFAFLNSSLNPLLYCWRYREIRVNVK